jgi:hypothetical protein
MTVPRTVAWLATLGLTLAAIALLSQSVACTNGTTPVCDDAGSCLILPNPPDASSAAADAGRDAASRD